MRAQCVSEMTGRGGGGFRGGFRGGSHGARGGRGGRGGSNAGFFFWTFGKKLKAKKTQNSTKNLKTQAQNSESRHFSLKKTCKKYSVGKLIDASIDENQ